MYNSFYVGIVVQNNDPEKRGRVKIFIPHINSHLIQDWLKKDGETQELKDIDFSFIGEDNNAELQQILSRLKETLPWAEFSGPIFGGNSTGRYNATTKKGYTQNHNQWKDREPAFLHRPAAEFSNANPPKDGFNNPLEVDQINPYSFAYDSANYSTLASGMFSIPNVGAHVWCFFENGDINYPVYFASTYSKEDFSRIYTQEKHTADSVQEVKGKAGVDLLNSSVDYPATYENIEDSEFAKDAQTFRSKHVINSNKHAIELVDTDNREILKFTHYSGSFKEFTNFTNIELATKNDQKLVIGDQFETVYSNKNIKVGDDFRTYVDGDCYEKVGTQTTNITKDIKDILTDIHQYFQLFDVRRARIYDGSDVIVGNEEILSADGLPNFISPLQKRQVSSQPIKKHSNGFTVCPICNAEEYKFDSPAFLAGLQPTPVIFSTPKLLGTLLNCESTGPLLSLVVNEPSLNVTIPTRKSDDLRVAFDLQEIQKIGIFAGGKCDVCNSDLLLLPDKQPGYSPSTFNGEWEKEVDKEPGGALDILIQQKSSEILELEKQMTGGDKIINIGKNKIETVGTIMNDLPSIRVDPVGKLRSENVYVAPESVYISYRPGPHIETVSTLNVPGGDYIITAMNKYKLLVGSNGINIKTFGPVDMYGTLFNISGQQINISSQYEVNIDGGDRFSLRGRKISFHPKEHSPVLVDGALHVSRNAIVRGGMHVDGQFATLAIASIREYGETSDGIWAPGVGAFGDGYSYVACGKTSPTVGAPQGLDVYVLIPEHTHLYERPPSQLFNSVQALRQFMADSEGKATANGNTTASINDVKLTTAAAPVNNSALGAAGGPVLEYKFILLDKINEKLSDNEEITSVILNINSAKTDQTGTQISGVMTLIIKDKKNNTYTYLVTYKINLEGDIFTGKKYASEAEPANLSLSSSSTGIEKTEKPLSEGELK